MTLILRPSLLALGLTLALTACGRAAPLTEQEQRTVTELTSHMKTRCVGRYLIDLPADVQTSGRATLEGVQVSTEKMTQQKFLKEMQQRESELRAIKHLDGYLFFYGDSEAYVKKSEATAIRKQGIWYFIHLGSIDAGASRRTIEVYKWDRDVRVQLVITGSDYTRPDRSNELMVQNIPPESRNTVDRKLVQALDLARHFHGRADDDIPTGPGVCFDGGFIAGAASDKERIESGFYLTGRRDVSVDFSSDSSYAEETTLLQRGGEINAAINAVQGKTIRNSVVKLSDISQAEEWLIASTTISGVPGHRFRLEANSKIGSTKTPLLILQMVNGVFPSNIPEAERTKASLTEGEAVALWDAVSRTIRVRPGAMDTMPLTPLPTPIPQVWSGQRCPQDGIWVAYCNQKDHTQYIAEGERMPTVSEKQLQPYRWLPERINAALAQRQRLPVTWVERKVKWLWIRPE